MRRTPKTPDLWSNMAMLAMESQQVILLRLMKIAAGGSNAQAETELMLSEKMTAGMHEGSRLMLGASADSVISAYRKKVRANVRRLTRKKSA